MLRRAVLAGLALCMCMLAAAAPSWDQLAAQQVASARVWLARNRPDLARVALQKALLLKKNDAQARLLLGELELKTNHPQEAYKQLVQLQQQFPAARATKQLSEDYRIATHDREAMAKIRLQARAGQGAAAFRQMQQLFPYGVPPGALGIEYYRLMAEQPGLRAKAMAGLQQQAEQEPQEPAYWLALGGLWVESADTRERGIELAMKLAKRPDVNRIEALALWKRGLQLGGDNPAHKAWLQAYLREAPADGTVRDILDHVLKAEEERRKLEADPYWQAGQRGVKALASNDLAGAEAELEIALPQRSGDAELLGAMGLLRMRQSRYPESIAWFGKAEAAEPGDKARWRNMAAVARFWGDMAAAKAALAAGKLDEAESMARSLATRQPKEAEAHALLGDVLSAKHNWSDAERAYRAALALGAYNSSALQGWVALLRTNGRGREIRPLLAQYQARFPAARGELDALRGRELADEAEALAKAKRNSRAITRYEEAIELIPRDPWVRFSLAGLYRDLGVPEQGSEVMQEGLQLEPGSAMHYAAALYFASLDQDDVALATLRAIAPTERNDDMRALELRLQVRSADTRALELAKQGQRDAALTALAQARQAAGDNPDLLGDIGQAYVSADLAEPGLTWLAGWLDAHPGAGTMALRLRYASLLEQAGRDQEQQAWLSGLEAMSGLTAEQRSELADRRVRLALRQELNQARQALAQQRYDEAEQHARKMLALKPQDQDAQRLLASLDERRQPEIDIGYNTSSKPGDPGISNLRLTEIPLYGQAPLGYAGHVFAEVDQVAISAGTVSRSDANTAGGFGTIAAFGMDTLRGPLEQSARGTAFGIGYRNDNWRFDIGHTPLEFPVNYWVGGVRWQASIGAGFYSVEVGQRPLTSSLLSYAGAHDPVTNQVWGGVRRLGVTLHGGWDVGPLGISSSLSLAQLSGQNVASNREILLRQAFDWSALKRAKWSLNLGLVANVWNYSNNQSDYTYGQGGYYSPQSYVSLGIPFELNGQAGRFAYRLGGTVGTSYSESRASDYYPTRPDLQALAAARAAADPALSTPVFQASKGGGDIGWNAEAALEYRATPHLVLGLVYGVDRSKSYAPDRALFYLRYSFKAQSAVPARPAAQPAYSAY
jgi:tetratricopeptide (TPR) repeat protein